MRIEYTEPYFVAYCKFSERHLFMQAGWKWAKDKKKWVTTLPKKVLKFRQFSTTGAKIILDSYKSKIELEVAPSKASTTNIVYGAPEGLEYFPFQNAGIEYILERKDTLLADQMGTGKTIMGVGVMNEINSQRTLIVCPASLKGNWLKEIYIWTTQRGLTVGIVSGDKFPDTDVVIINFEMLAKHADNTGRILWDLLIIDECHYIKNKKSARAKRVYGYGRGKKRIRKLKAVKRLWLTGTPILNKPIDIWPIIEAFDPHGLGKDWEKFVYRYCNAEETHFGTDTSGASNLEELQHYLRKNFMIRRLKKDVLKELPEKTRQVITLPKKGMVKIVREEMSFFEQNMAMLEDLNEDYIEDERISPLDAMQHITEKHGDTMTDKVEQIQIDEGVMFESAALLRKDIALGKLPMCIEYINMLREGGAGKVVIFAHHSEIIDGLMAHYHNSAVKIDGTVPVNRRQEQVDLFQNNKDVTEFIGNIQAASTGHTLTAASIVIFVELCYVPATMLQAEDRIHRIGQKNACNIHYLVLEDSLEANMIQSLIAKEVIIEEALD